MILLPKQAKRFYKLFDAVIIFANERLGVSKRLITPFGEIDDGEVAKVCDALWSGTANRPVIGELIDENPYGFSRTDLREIAQWEHAINGDFFIMRRGEDMFFLYEGHAVAVRGITREIDTMLTYVPTVARTTLLPFDGLIVYAMSLSEHPLDFGDALRGTLDAELEKMISNRKVIQSAKQLVDRAPQLEEERISRAAAEFVRDAELDMNADEQAEWQHRGALAGLTGRKRDEAIIRYVDEKGAGSGIDAKEQVRRFSKSCMRGKPVSTLDEAYGKLNNHELRQLASAMGAQGAVSSWNKEKLLDYVVSRFPRDPDSLASRARTAGSSAMEDAWYLYEAGGRIEVADEDSLDEGALIAPLFPIILSFHQDGKFIFIMPDEVREAFSCLDWDAELARAREVDGIIHFFDLALDLRGVAYLSELMHEYVERYGESESVDIEELGYSLLASGIGELIILDDEPVLVGMRVISALGHFPREEQVEDEARYYLVEQGKKPIRPVPDELEDAGEVVEWMIDSPEAQALIAYLDEHVPEEEDEYFWAEDTVCMLIDGFRAFVNPTEALKDAFGEEMPFTEAQLKRVLDLSMALANAVPRWENNGWSPNELFSAMKR